MTRHLPTLAKYAALLVAAVLTLGPVWWTFTTSLRPAAESFSLPPSFFPLQPDFSSYAAVFEQIKIPLLVLNSALVTALIAVGQMLTAAMAGYVFARIEFRGRGLLFAIVLSTMMVPVQVTIIVHSTITNSRDRKSTRLNSSHVAISYAVFCLKKK